MEGEEDTGENEEDDLESNASLPPLRQHANRFLALAEPVSLLILIFFSVGRVPKRGTRELSLSAVSILCSAYLMLLYTGRSPIFQVSYRFQAKLWRHGAVLYGFFWLNALLLVHADLVESSSPGELVALLVQVGLWSILLILALTALVQHRDDHLGCQSRRPHPVELTVSVLSQFSFHWAGRLIGHACHDLQESDLPDLHPNLRSPRVLSSFRKIYRMSSASLLRRLLWFFR